ncbi:unnamed protein product [Phytophthora fragariaefolia]|uniref:Unnamed protein product n=1 Tax=Phytophthora fragariaefolia TaxID=1490495 RepID=A0A9W6U1U1_9STRA|nr:unnamed protein product [Phytophthora fragariaefolia]
MDAGVILENDPMHDVGRCELFQRYERLANFVTQNVDKSKLPTDLQDLNTPSNLNSAARQQDGTGQPQSAELVTDAKYIFAYVGEAGRPEDERKSDGNGSNMDGIDGELGYSDGESPDMMGNADTTRLEKGATGRAKTMRLLPGERLGWWSAQKFDRRVRMRALVMGAVNDQRTKILLDTGANISAINEVFARKLRLKRQISRDVQIGVQGIGKDKVGTSTRAWVKVTLGWEVSYEFEVWIMDHHAGVDLILSTDFMIPAGICLDLYNSLAKLPDEVVVPLIKSQNSADDPRGGLQITDGPTETICLPGRLTAEFRIRRRQPAESTHELWVRPTLFPPHKDRAADTDSAQSTQHTKDEGTLSRGPEGYSDSAETAKRLIQNEIDPSRVNRKHANSAKSSIKLNSNDGAPSRVRGSGRNLVEVSAETERGTGTFSRVTDAVVSSAESVDGNLKTTKIEVRGNPPYRGRRSEEIDVGDELLDADPETNLHLRYLLTAELDDDGNGGSELGEQSDTYERTPNTLALEDYAHELVFLPDLTDVIPIQLDYSADNVVCGTHSAEQTTPLVKHLPIRQRARRVPLKHLKKLYELLKALLKAGLIAFSNSPWASPIVIERKKNGVDIRLCIDYKLVNAITLMMEYAMPLVDDLLTELDAYLWFCSLDAASGFWAVMMTRRARWISAFVCSLGHFEWLRMPFGLENAPMIYQRLIDNALWGYVQPKEGWEAFADRVSRVEQEAEAQRETYSTDMAFKPTRLTKFDADRRAALAESDAMQEFIDSPEADMFATGEPDQSDLVPVFERRSFVDGICFGGQTFDECLDTLDRLLKRFAECRIILYQLKEDDFAQGGDLTAAKAVFSELKKKVVEAPILRHFDSAKDVYIMLFANDWAFSSTMMQLHDDKLRPVRFCGRVLKENEINYHPAVKEVLALLQLLKVCYTQLAGRKLHIAASAHLPSTTVNIAEYTGMNNGVIAALQRGVSDLISVGDSQLAIQQSMGVIACRKDALQVELARHKGFTKKLNSVRYLHVVRLYNSAADSMATEALEAKAGRVVLSTERKAEWRALNKIPEMLYACKNSADTRGNSADGDRNSADDERNSADANENSAKAAEEPSVTATTQVLENRSRPPTRRRTTRHKTEFGENQDIAERPVELGEVMTPDANDIDPLVIQAERRQRISTAQDEELRWADLKTYLKGEFT